MTRLLPAVSLALWAVVLCEPAVAQSAVIEGTVWAEPGPARKTAPRYPAGAAPARPMQAVPVVVYLEDTSGSTGSGAGAALATVEITQRDTVFVPSAIAVRTGTVVQFPNEDPFFHNVFSYAANARFDLGRYPQGQSRQYTFDRPGIAHVFCEVHPFMRATIVVTTHRYHVVTDANGAFRIAGVPPGEHTVVAFHPDLGSLRQRVEVGTRGTLNLELAFGS